MACRTWGQYNFETFDGLYYYFPGRCTYTLLKDCEETTQAGIVVQVRPDLRLRLHRRFSASRQLLATFSIQKHSPLSYALEVPSQAGGRIYSED